MTTFSYDEVIARKGLEVPHDPPEKFTIDEVPSTGGSSSRFNLRRTAGGWESTPATCSADVFEKLVRRFEASLTAPSPERVTVPLKRVRLVSTEPEYRLDQVKPYSDLPTYLPGAKTDGRFKKIAQTGGGLLDATLLGEINYADPSDDDLFDALLLHCEQTRADGRECLRLSEAIIRFVCLRKGIVWKGNL